MTPKICRYFWPFCAKLEALLQACSLLSVNVWYLYLQFKPHVNLFTVMLYVLISIGAATVGDQTHPSFDTVSD